MIANTYFENSKIKFDVIDKFLHPSKDLAIFRLSYKNSNVVDHPIDDIEKNATILNLTFDKIFHDLNIQGSTQVPFSTRTLENIGESFIYHYPMGVRDQRVNKGPILTIGTHHITTLPGSSGAPIFDSNGYIFGIHVASSGDVIGKVVCSFPASTEEGKRTFDLSRNNGYERTLQKDYNFLAESLLNGRREECTCRMF